MVSNNVYFKIISDLFFITAFFTVTICNAQVKQVYEAENAELSGTAIIVDCNSASGGQMVKGLDGDKENSITFSTINLSQGGEYFISVNYFSVNIMNMTCRLNDDPEIIKSVPASGLWCYQGGVPATFTFKANFKEGENQMVFYQSPIIDNIIILSDTTKRSPSTFFVSSTLGDDENDGKTENTPWKTLEKVNVLDLLPGDSLLFKTNDTIKGELIIYNEGGKIDFPVFIGSYGDSDKPVLDGNGYMSAIHVINSGYLEFSDIEIKNDGGEPQPGEPDNIRYGIYIENTKNDGTEYEHYRLKNLTFKNIYPTIAVTDDDKTGVNGYAINTSGSWGDQIHPSRFDNMKIENCYFTRTGRHAAVFGAVNNLVIKNNIFEYVGGAGMVIGNNCSNILVEGNITNYTGSKIDERMAGRGSGLWCYQCKNLTVQHNKFKHARGINDSYGMHIDIGNQNVVYQYNLSEDNEGGFAEILGKNVNVGYRYNLSIGDGWRKRGNRFGQIFWLAGWSGDPQNPIGSDSIFIYNNSIYVRDTIEPGIWIENVSKHARIYNNIIYASNQFGPVVIKNSAGMNNFDYNIWYGKIPTLDEDGELYRGLHARTYNPLFHDEIVTDSSCFVLQSDSPAKNSGKIIYNSAHQGEYDYFFTNGGEDYYGNLISLIQRPNIGAYNGPGLTSNVYKDQNIKNRIQLFPNPAGQDEGISIIFPKIITNEKISVQIFDITGKIVFSQNYSSSQLITFNPKLAAKGIYMLHIDAVKFNETRKLIIQ